MKKTEFYAPQIDAIIEGSSPGNNHISHGTYLKLKDIYKAFSCIKAGVDDEIRHTWLEVDRGPVEAFGDYEEFRESGEVSSRKEFEQLWKDYYPDKTKWYGFQTAKYEGTFYFYINGKLLFSIKDDETPVDKNNDPDEFFDGFVEWLEKRVLSEMSKLRQESHTYNSYIQQNLSWSKRYGRIKRKDYWEILGDNAIRPDKKLGEKIISKLEVLVSDMKNKDMKLLPEMTANNFFRICEICYDANDYFKNSKETFTPQQKYLKMADGRDAGLRNIEGESPQAFKEWYHNGERMGAHPWEICRGGNSTHISLFVSEVDNEWGIWLAGSSIARVEETVKMAVALHENNISFKLSDADEIVRMVTGNDFIGIVPDTVFPRYCHSLFPKEDNIIDFMNLGPDIDIIPELIQKIYWYPLEEIIPEKGN